MARRAFLFSAIFILSLMVGTFAVFNSLALRDFAKRLIITQSYYKFGINVDVEDVRISYFRPSIRIKNIKLIKEDEKNKINLSAKEATVYFNIIKLIRGEIGISGFRLKSPHGEMDLSTETSNKNKKIDINSIWDEVVKSNIDKIRIDDGTFKIKIKIDGVEKYFGFDKLNVNIRRGIISNYVIDLSAGKAEIPISQIQSFDIRADIRKNNLKLNKAEIGISGGKIYVGGLIKDLAVYPATSVNLAWRTEFDLSKVNDYENLIGKDIAKDFKKGNIVLGGKTTGKMTEGLKNLSHDLSLTIVNLMWGNLTVPKIDLRARYSDQVAFVSKLDVSDGEKSISVYDTDVLLKAPYSIKGRGTVNDVELSRFIELFDIKRCLSFFHVNGPFTFSGSLSPELKITGLFDLKVKDFWVLKKKGLELKKENSILDFKNGSVYGKVVFSKKGVYFDNTQAKSEENLLNVNGWITDKSTVDIDVKSSDFSMDTYGRIADLLVNGKGLIQTKLIVDDNGDFKTRGSLDFKNLRLLNGYNLGTVSSKVTYDGYKLSFVDIKGRTGDSPYSGQTDIIFDDNQDVLLKGKCDFKNIYTEDLYKLFEIKDKLFGSPSAIVSGSVKFDGRPSWEQIRLDWDIEMSDIEFASERFDKMYANFVWNKGNVLISDLYLLRGKSRFNFEGSRKNGVFNLSVSSNKIDLSDISFFSGHSEIDGALNVKGTIKHSNKKLSGSIKFNLSDLAMNQNKLKPISADLVFGDKTSVSLNLFDGSAIGTITQETSDSYKIKAKLKDFDVYPLSIFTQLNVESFKTSTDGDLELILNKNGGINWAKVDLTGLKLNSSFINLKSKGRVFTEYSGGNYSINNFSLLADYEGGRCQLDFIPSGKNIAIRGCVPASSLNIFKDYIAGARGTTDVDLIYDGKLKGIIYLRDVGVTPIGHRVGSINIAGKIPVENSSLKLNYLNLSSGSALASFSGDLNVSKMLNLTSFYPSANFKVGIDKLYLEYPDDLKGTWTGSIDVKGTDIPYVVSGYMTLYDASYRKDFELAKLAISSPKKLDSSLMLKRDKPSCFFDIKLKSATDVYIKNTMMTGDVGFDIKLTGTDKDPKILGSLDLLRGTFIYLDNTFNLISGRVKFRDDEIEPVVYQLDSESKVGNYQVYLKILSERGEPNFNVSSTPTLSEEKIVTLLTTGDVQSDFMDQGSMTTGTGGNIVSEGLGVTGSIKKNTGVGMRLKTPTTKNSSMPDVEFQKDLTNDLKVIYGKSLDESTNKQQVNVQYDVNRNVQLKLLFEEEKNDNVSKDQPSNAGVDIKFKFEF